MSTTLDDELKLIKDALTRLELTAEVAQRQQMMLDLIQGQMTTLLLVNKPWFQGLLFVLFFLAGIGFTIGYQWLRS